MGDVASMSFLAIGRKYGVSDNAVRKWIRWYECERERTAAEGVTPDEEAA
jgi:transposase-like protein